MSGGVFFDDAVWEVNRRTQARLAARRKYSAGADSSSPLNVPQQAHAIGDPVPIVFARRRSGAGGILISPRATECRFENDVNNAVTAYYHLVLSEGRIGDIQVRDVFQRQCRVGSFQQTYDRRAGSWIPENAIVPQTGFNKPEASNFCGSVGTYDGMTTMSFEVTIPNGFDVWNRQVHAFIRDGIEVYRWADAQSNVSSDSFADLAYWMMVNSARIPAALIDTASIQTASRFLNANNITTNCWITKPVNYDELVTAWGRYHLLRPVTSKGKVGLKPLLPINEDYTIKTTALAIDYVFDYDTIIPGSVDIQYVDWTSRQPFVCQVIWRQQNESDIGVVRTSEVRYDGTAANGPYESHDLSEFCTREEHAVRIGAYILAQRVRSSHSIRFRARPGLHTSTLEQGSIIRVRLLHATEDGGSTLHDRIYEVERIQRTLAGEVVYEANHLPMDNQLRSLIALDVMSATVSGVLFPSGLTGEGCDLNSASDTTVPEDGEDDTITPGPEDPAIEGGGDVEIDQEDYPIDEPADDNLIDDAELDEFIDDLTDDELIEIIDDLEDDVADELRELTDEELADLVRELDDEDLADLIRDLTDEELEELFEELTPEEVRDLTDEELADEARDLTDEELADIVRDLEDEELIKLLDDPVKEVIKEDLDLDFDPELVEELIIKVKEAKEEQEADDQVDPLAEYEAGIYFHSATWDETTLTVAMRLAPTGRAPREDLGPLDVTIASTSVVALLPGGQLANPQPESLPTVSFTGEIAEPWDAEAEGVPVPPGNRIFEGQFVISFGEGDFPPAAEDPAEQLTYRATVEFTDWEGGFTDVSFLNTLTVDFVPSTPPEELVIWYPDEPPPEVTIEGVTVSELADPYETVVFQGVNALQAPYAELLEGPSWRFDNINSAFDVASGPFTLEFWWRAGTSLATGGDNFTTFVQVDFRNDPEGLAPLDGFVVQLSSRYVIENVEFEDGTPKINLQLASEDESIFETHEEIISTSDATSLNHVAIQKHSTTSYTLHYKGILLTSFTAESLLFSNKSIGVLLESENVNGAAISQIRLSNSALYGTGSFTPPSTAFYMPPS
jgi:hypothetical protein